MEVIQPVGTGVIDPQVFDDLGDVAFFILFQVEGCIPVDNRLPVTILEGLPLGILLDKIFHALDGKLLADNGILYPEYELAVLVVGDFCFIHPESIHGNGPAHGILSPGYIHIAGAHGKGTIRYGYHSMWLGLCIGPPAFNAHQFAGVVGATSSGDHPKNNKKHNTLHSTTLNRCKNQLFPIV